MSKILPRRAARRTAVNGIDNRAHPDVVGQYLDAHSVAHGFVLRNGKFKTIHSPFGTNTSINAINVHRRIVGSYDSGGPQGGFEAALSDSDDDGPEHGASWLAVNYPAYEDASVVLTWGLDDVDGNFQELGGGVDWNDAYTTVPNAINTSGIIVGTTTDHYGTQGKAWLP